MPTLDWIGKRAVVGHAREVAYRLLKCDDALSWGDAASGNLLVEGDNLRALKALLPFYAASVKCIYIDPPYNTGNEGWIYNDAVNAPEIKKWLGQTVGKEAEDLSRHDKWLCMMYPRLVLLRQMLRNDGAIFISIDDNEVHHLRALMDEIFGARNFVANVVWQKNFAPNNSARQFSESHDHIVVYAKSAETWAPNLLARGDAQDERYKNPDNDPRKEWTSSDLTARNFYSLGSYEVTSPKGRTFSPPRGRYWGVSKENFDGLDADKRIWWGANGNSMPRLKRFLSEVKEGITSQTIWMHSEVGNTQEAKKELLALLPNAENVFITPKPTRLIKRILQLATDKDSIVLDSFAGSGTTGQAVMQLNEEDGGRRRCVLIEMEPTIARPVTRERLVQASTNPKRERGAFGKGGDGLFQSADADEAQPVVAQPVAKDKPVAEAQPVAYAPGSWGFRFCTLGEPLFEGDGGIRRGVAFRDLAHHVFFTETGRPLPATHKGTAPLLGVQDGTALYLLWQPGEARVLDEAALKICKGHRGAKVIYADGCRVSLSRLRRANAQFKQVPYEVKT